MGFTDFGDELRRRRSSAGLSLTELAKLVNYSKGHLSKIENGLKAPLPPLPRVCDQALDAGGALMALAEATPPRAREAVSGPGDHWTVSLRADGSGGFWIGERTGPGPAVTAVPALAFGPPEEGVDALAAMFAQTRRLGRTAGPGAVLPLAMAQAHGAAALARSSRGRHRDRLFVLAARITEFTGWMAQEAGDGKGALWWTDRAVELAEAGGEAGLADYALVRRALLTLYGDDAAATVDLAGRAYRHGAAHPRTRWLAALRTAQGHALGLNDTLARKALDDAETLREAVLREGEEGALGPSPLRERASITAGWCHYDLGNLEEAAAELDRALPGIPQARHRDRARYGTRHALVHAALGDVGRACELMEPLLPLIRSVDSATIRTDLREFARTLGRHRRDPAARRLHPLLAHTLSGR